MNNINEDDRFLFSRSAQHMHSSSLSFTQNRAKLSVFFIVHFLVVLSASYLFPSLQVQEKSLQYKDNARDIFGKICYEKMKWVVVVVWRLQRSRNLKIPAFCQEKLNVKQLKLRNLS